jgi:hypothetical protein
MIPIAAVHIAEVVITAAIIGIGTWIIRDHRRRHADETARDNVLGEIVQLFTGTDANPVTGTDAAPGLVAQVNTLRKRQEQIADQVNYELTPNGGHSLKDAANQAAASAEAAAAAAAIAVHTTEETQRLLRRHMQNGVEIMEVGQENDASFRAAFLELGVELPPFREYPPVDTGD